MAKDDSLLTRKEANTCQTYYILELSLLFSKSETAKMKIEKNKSARGSRPVPGRGLSSTCFSIRRLAVPGFGISRTKVTPLFLS